jgi:hypothetical protein
MPLTLIQKLPTQLIIPHKKILPLNHKQKTRLNYIKLTHSPSPGATRLNPKSLISQTDIQ